MDQHLAASMQRLNFSKCPIFIGVGKFGGLKVHIQIQIHSDPLLMDYLMHYKLVSAASRLNVNFTQSLIYLTGCGIIPWTIFFQFGLSFKFLASGLITRILDVSIMRKVLVVLKYLIHAPRVEGMRWILHRLLFFEILYLNCFYEFLALFQLCPMVYNLPMNEK